MIVDSSAILAVLLKERRHKALVARMSTEPVRVGAPTLVETGIVLHARLGLIGWTLLSRLVEEGGWNVVPFTEQHTAVAIDAYRRFGKGRHAAALNFGDCMTYAVARVAAEPLLCLGDDFTKTDLELAAD